MEEIPRELIVVGGGVIGLERDGRMRSCLGDPDDSGLGPSVEDGHVLCHRDPSGRLVECR